MSFAPSATFYEPVPALKCVEKPETLETARFAVKTYCTASNKPMAVKCHNLLLRCDSATVYKGFVNDLFTIAKAID